MGDELKPAATSWRDVYDLVRDTRADIMVAVGNVDTKVTHISTRVTLIEDDRRDEKVARQSAEAVVNKQQKRLMTMIAASRNGIAIAISVVTFAVAVLRLHL